MNDRVGAVALVEVYPSAQNHHVDGLDPYSGDRSAMALHGGLGLAHQVLHRHLGLDVAQAPSHIGPARSEDHRSLNSSETGSQEFGVGGGELPGVLGCRRHGFHRASLSGSGRTAVRWVISPLASTRL